MSGNQIERTRLPRESGKQFQIRSRNRGVVGGPGTSSNKPHHSFRLCQFVQSRLVFTTKTDKKQQTRQCLGLALSFDNSVRFKTGLELPGRIGAADFINSGCNRSSVADSEETAKAARFNLPLNQTQQQLIVRKIWPPREDQLQRKCRLAAAGWTNDQNSLFTFRRDHARAVKLE